MPPEDQEPEWKPSKEEWEEFTTNQEMETMTEHDRIRASRAIKCNRNNEQELIEAIGGLQSTDDPSLVPLYNELQDDLQKLRERKTMTHSNGNWMNDDQKSATRDAAEVKDAEIVTTNTGTQIATFSPTKAEIAKLKETYAPLTADTEEGYEKVRHALAVMVKHRTGVESVRKQLVADALKYQRDINGKAKDLTALLEEIESPLRAKKDAVDKAEEEAIKAKLKAEDDAKRAKEEAERAAREAELKAIRDAEQALIAAERKKLAEEAAALEKERQRVAQEQERQRQAEDSKRKEAQTQIDAENARQAEEHRKARAQLEAEIAAERKVRAEAEAKAQADRDRMETERRAIQAEKDAIERQKREAQEAKERAEFERQAKEKAEKDAREEIARQDAIQARLNAEAKAEAEAEAKRIEAARPDGAKIETLGKTLRIMSKNLPVMATDEGLNFMAAVADQFTMLAERCEQCGIGHAPAKTITKKGKS